ncbi:MAG: sugar-binding domain-containing protein [Propionibacteriaceae bacterium]|nr:sugar-binding domain-containing protein [Propionibacteriaceae bacterium]
MQQLLNVARMYYMENLSQAEIADRVGYSRPTVSKMLTEARAKGMVRISIEHPLQQAFELERQLTKRFGLKVALVAGADHRSSAEAVGEVAAGLVAESGNAHTVLALSNGTSVAAVVHAMPQRHWQYSSVVQMVGSLAQVGADMVDSPELCRLMARRLGGTYRPMPVPLVLGSAAMAQAMRQEELVLTTLELAARSDIALTGVGAVGPEGHPGAILAPWVTPSLAAEVHRRGAVAHVSGHYFDASGRHIKDPMCDRLIAMDPERLGEIELSLAVAWGAEKVAALHAVLRAGLISGLATDEVTARLLLSHRP